MLFCSRAPSRILVVMSPQAPLSCEFLTFLVCSDSDRFEDQAFCWRMALKGMDVMFLRKSKVYGVMGVGEKHGGGEVPFSFHPLEALFLVICGSVVVWEQIACDSHSLLHLFKCLYGSEGGLSRCACHVNLRRMRVLLLVHEAVCRCQLDPAE